jgi:hypothetical protein
MTDYYIGQDQNGTPVYEGDTLASDFYKNCKCRIERDASIEQGYRIPPYWWDLQASILWKCGPNNPNRKHCSGCDVTCECGG